MMNPSLKEIKLLAQNILSANSFVLTTHKNCDADGLGSMISFYHALTSIGKKVQAFSVDPVPPRYSFMNYEGIVFNFENSDVEVQKADLALIFDTHDPKLIEPLYFSLKKKCKKIIFIDHHDYGDSVKDHLINEGASSTGEICYSLFEQMSIPMNQDMAQAIYTSIIFDTRMFRSSKNLSKAFYICSRLCDQIGSHDIYEKLFCSYDKNSWNQIIKILSCVQYSENEKIGWIELNYDQFKKSELKIFHLLDCLDFIMKRKSIIVGLLSVERNFQEYKISLRSKGNVNVRQVAHFFGGGGHSRSAGMIMNEYPRDKILKKIFQIL